MLQAFFKLLMTPGCLILFQREHDKRVWSSGHVDRAGQLRAALQSCLGPLGRILRPTRLVSQLLQGGLLSPTWRDQPDADILSQGEEEGWGHVSQYLQGLLSLTLLLPPNLALISHQGGTGAVWPTTLWSGEGYPILNKLPSHSAISGPTIISTSRA